MRPTLAATAESQNGIFVRHQALTAGYTRREFDRMTRGATSPWVRVRYGVYAVRAPWEALSDDERAMLVDEAALLVCDAGTVLSHSSAARRLRLPLYGAQDGLTHVTRLRTDGRVLSRIQAGIKHHCGCLEETEIVTADGYLTTDPVRTVLDMTSEFGYRGGLVVADAALRAGSSKEQLVERARRCTSLSHAPVLRAVAEDADGRAETPIETLGRILLVAMGVADLEPQYEIALAEGGKAFVDLFSPRLHHVFECDGRLKYRDQLDTRGRVMRAEDVLWSEKKREDAIRSQGFGFSRILWRDTMVDRFGPASARLWREIGHQDATRDRSRYGT
jgi:hypothetical protein